MRLDYKIINHVTKCVKKLNNTAHIMKVAPPCARQMAGERIAEDRNGVLTKNYKNVHSVRPRCFVV
jgi:hypothetical protein